MGSPNSVRSGEARSGLYDALTTTTRKVRNKRCRGKDAAERLLRPTQGNPVLRPYVTCRPAFSRRVWPDGQRDLKSDATNRRSDNRH
jgi:hypothetical protein